MLTLVAAVLVCDRAYDWALDMGEPRDNWERWSSSRNVRSETRVENDILLFNGGGGDVWIRQL